MNDREPNGELADLKTAIAQLWKSVEALKTESSQHADQITQILNQWIQTNHRLLDNLINNTKVISDSASNYESSTRSLINLKEQLITSGESTKQLVEILSGLTNFHQSIKSSQEGLDMMIKNLQSVYTILQKLDRRILKASQKSNANLWMWGSLLAIVLMSAVANMMMLRVSSAHIEAVLDKVQHLK